MKLFADECVYAVLKDVHIVLRKLLQNRSQESLNKSLAIVDRNKYRIRRA